MTSSNLLPEEVQCPNCGVELKLNEEERARRQFTCSVCRESFTVSPEAKYCPECGAEYRPEISACADCHVPLVEALPVDTAEQEPEKFLEVMSTYNIGDLAVIKSVLDGEQVAYYLHNENFHALNPWIKPVKIFVRENHVEMARELLQGLDLHAMAISLTTEQKDDDVLGGKE